MPKNTAAVTALGGGPAEEEDWKAKYERSEGARQHLRKQLELVKLHAVNTQQLIQRCEQLETELAAAKAAQKKAEAAVAKAKKAAAANAGGGRAKAAAAAPAAAPASAVHAAPANNAALAAEVGRLGGQMTELIGLVKASLERSKSPMQPRAGAGAVKTAAPPAKGAAAEAGNGGDVRARAAAQVRRAAPEKEAAPHKPPPKKRVRVQEPPVAAEGEAAAGAAAGEVLLPQPTKRQKKQKQHLQQVTSPPAVLQPAVPQQILPAVPGGEEFIPHDAEEREGERGYADAVTDALNAVKHASVEAMAAAAAEAVAIIRSGGGLAEGSFEQRAAVAAVVHAVLGCAAPVALAQLAPPQFSPMAWIGGDSVSSNKQGQNSFIGTWHASQALESHLLEWLLHVLTQIDIEAAAGGEEDEAAAAASPQKNPQKQRKGGDTAQQEGLCMRAAVARELARGVVFYLARRKAQTNSKNNLNVAHGMTPTEACAASAAAAALWRSLGDEFSMQAFLIDALRAQQGSEEESLPAVTAALEAWPNALPKSGAFRGAVLGVLQHACAAAEERKDEGLGVEARAAGDWLEKLGKRAWGWREGEKEWGSVESSWQKLPQLDGK